MLFKVDVKEVHRKATEICESPCCTTRLCRASKILMLADNADTNGIIYLMLTEDEFEALYLEEVWKNHD